MQFLKKLFGSKEKPLSYTPADLSGGETVYLTKMENGQVHHYRVTVEKTGVAIVNGIFYKWLTKMWQGYGTRDAALVKQKELVNEKLAEGYAITDFKELPENTTDVYDKAKWHFGGDFPKGLDNFQGYVHTGMFLGWLIDNNLVSEEFIENSEEMIEGFRQKKLTGAQVFEFCCDGVLMLEDINETGNRFALEYFDFSTGSYLPDYEKTLATNLPSTYHVQDNWENYEKLKPVIDKRFMEWKQSVV